LNCEVMAMRADVPVDTCPLPLDGAAVARVYRSQNLVWTVNDALCALAHADPEKLAAPRASLPGWVDPAPDGYARPRLPKLPPRPQHAQLSLFD
jgi:hypothetical protein